MMPRASFRLLRTGLIVSIIVGLAAGGHLAAGGTLPEPAVLFAVCALAVLPVSVLSRYRLSFPVLVGVLGAGQAWLHWAFHTLSTSVPLGGPGVTGHGQHLAALPVDVLGAAQNASADGYGTLMFLAHAAATLVTAIVLSRGEQALWTMAAWLRPLVQLPAVSALVPARVPSPCYPPLVLPLDQAIVSLPAPRGPPAMLSAA